MVKRGPSGLAEGDPEGATLTTVMTAPPHGRVREPPWQAHHGPARAKWGADGPLLAGDPDINQVINCREVLAVVRDQDRVVNARGRGDREVRGPPPRLTTTGRHDRL